MPFVSVQLVYRNDGYRERKMYFQVFQKQHEAVKHILSELDDEWMEDKYYGCVLEYLEKGRGVWIPEWERKGNGDEYFVIETDKPEMFTPEVQDFINKEFSALGIKFNKDDWCNRETLKPEEIYEKYKTK